MNQLYKKPEYRSGIKMSHSEFQGELAYYRALKMIQKMRDKGLITEDEFRRIDVLNRKSFTPVFAQLIA